MIVVVIGFGTAARFYFVSWIGERVVADIRSSATQFIKVISKFLRGK